MVYIVAFFLCIILLLLTNNGKNKKLIKWFNILILVYLAILSGTRYEMGGWDYDIYRQYFNSVPNLQTLFVQIHEGVKTTGIIDYEFGYKLLNAAVKSLGMNFYGFTLVHSIIFYSLFYIGVRRYSNNFALVILVFLYKLFFYNTFVSMRQSLSLVIFLVVMRYIEERKPLKYTLGCFIALQFHNGSIILFPLYLLSYFILSKKRIKYLNIVFILTLIISKMKIPILDFIIPYLQMAENLSFQDKSVKWISSYNENLSMFHTVEFFVIMFLVYNFYNNIIKADKRSEFILKIYLVLLPIMTLLSNYILFTREKDFFVITYALILGYLCMSLIEKVRATYAIKLGIFKLAILLICIFGFWKFMIQFNSGEMIHYKSYLFKGISIFENAQY